MAAIQLDRVTKSFGATPVLNGISLSIKDGEFLSLVGPSGCGKSTLLRIIAGLEQQTSGHVRIGAERVDGIRPSERNLAMVFQSYALYPHLSVRDNIAVPLRMRRLSATQRMPGARLLSARTRAIEATIEQDIGRVAALLDIEPLLARKPAQLSGGQRQRVAVGRAIVRDPRAFLLDEPLSNLDAKLRVHMRTEIAQLHRRLAATFIYVTHDQAEAMTMSDRIAVMMDGELVQVGTPDEVYEDPNDLRVAEFIGSPKINALPGTITPTGIRCLEMVLPMRAEAGFDRGVRIGIRPEALRVGARERVGFEGVITHIENLGAERYVHLAVGEQQTAVVVRADPEAVRHTAIGERLPVSFGLHDVRVFDASGRRTRCHLPDAGRSSLGWSSGAGRG